MPRSDQTDAGAHRPPPSPTGIEALVVVAVGGALGSLLRWGVAAAWPDDIAATTLTVLGTGFCGALTTWSTFVVDAAERIEAGERRSAAAVVVASLALGGGAAALGLALTGGL